LLAYKVLVNGQSGGSHAANPTNSRGFAFSGEGRVNKWQEAALLLFSRLNRRAILR
jgi:hypothetical protein